MTEDKVRRSIRSTAGNRYDALLRSEEKDEFYEGHYGGFTEEENDDDFSGKIHVTNHSKGLNSSKDRAAPMKVFRIQARRKAKNRKPNQTRPKK